jgi:hypothetical protein
MSARNPAMPGACAPPAAVLAWLDTLRARDGVTTSLLLTMRWLVLEELERLGAGAPEAQDKPAE